MKEKNKKIKKAKEEEVNKKAPSNVQSRITSEYNKLSKIFVSSYPEKNHVIKKLIKRASFLLILAEEMEKDIRESDLTTETINASQSFIKSNPLLKDYRDTVKSYQTVVKQLCDLVGKESTSDRDKPDELEVFLKS